MSAPKRYSLRLPEISYGTEENPNGEYVGYSDYAALQAENERLRKYWKATGEGVNKYVGKSLELEDKVAALEAENERLAEFMKRFDWILYTHNCKGGTSATHDALDKLRNDYLEWMNPEEEQS